MGKEQPVKTNTEVKKHRFTLCLMYTNAFVEILAKGAEGGDNTTVTDPSVFVEHKDNGRGW